MRTQADPPAADLDDWLNRWLDGPDDDEGTAVEQVRVHLLELREGKAALEAAALGAPWPPRPDVFAAPRLWRALSTPGVVRLMETVVLRSHPMERLLTGMRRAWALERAPADRFPKLASALAVQAFLTGYAYQTEDDEIKAVHAAVLGLSPEPAPLPTLPVVLAAAYRSLRDWDQLEPLLPRIVAGKLPALEAIVRAQVLDPRREAELLVALRTGHAATARTSGAQVPGSGVKDRALTTQVGAFYEAYPYPRWRRLPRIHPVPLLPYLRSRLPHATVHAVGPEDDVELARPTVLVAGCGSGLHPLTLARRMPAADVVAVDLSGASLAYAARRAEEEGIGNVTFVQGDLLTLDDWPTSEQGGKGFQLVESVGVLQHLADPLEGWGVLARRLAPGGFMKLGVYSRAARDPVRRASRLLRHLGSDGMGADPVEAEGMPGPGTIPTTAALRSLRSRLTKALQDQSWGGHVLDHPDYFTLDEFRDLLLHPQEVSFTIPQLSETMEALGLEFLGFDDLPPPVVAAFRAAHPDGASDLSAWAAFEETHPYTFSRLYRFWCRRPA